MAQATAARLVALMEGMGMGDDEDGGEDEGVGGLDETDAGAQ